MTVFADQIFPVPMGLAVEEQYGKDGKYLGCRVYVGNSPDLLVLEDTDGDDKADKRYPLLTGFGGVDSDHGVHGMVLGLDGKLYFTHGDGCCSVQQDHSRADPELRRRRQVGPARLRPTSSPTPCGSTATAPQFEILADRQRNNYETSLNAFGNVFTSDNDDDGNRGCRVIWVMDGGHYGYRTPGQPPALGRGRARATSPSSSAPATAAPAGIMVYEGDLLPEEYHGGVLEAEAGTRQINFFPLTRHGAAFRTEYKVFLASDDPWFRPVDVTAAPDGSVFVADWYDAGVGGHAFRDQTTGRIYRVAPKGHEARGREGRLRHRPRPDRGAQVAGRRHPGRRPPRPDRARPKDRQAGGRDGARRTCSRRASRIERARALWVLHAVAGDQAADRRPEGRRPADPRAGRPDPRPRRPRERPRRVHEARGQAAARPPRGHLDDLLPMAADPDAGRPPRADPGLPQPADRPGRRGPQDPRRGLGRPGPLVPRGARPGAREPRVARSSPSCSTARSTATSTSTNAGQDEPGRPAAVLPGRPQRGVHRRRARRTCRPRP